MNKNPLEDRRRRYTFLLNPYADARFTRCPQCERKTRQRKLPLVIHVEPRTLIALNKTCRYCPACDLLIAHQDEIETFLAAFLGQSQPAVVGNDYLVLGTLDRPDWRQGQQAPTTPAALLDRTYIFNDSVRFTPAGGWGPR